MAVACSFSSARWSATFFASSSRDKTARPRSEIIP
jgi:hypothetical protein